SDVCSSDLRVQPAMRARREILEHEALGISADLARRDLERGERVAVRAIGDEDDALARTDRERARNGAASGVGQNRVYHLPSVSPALTTGDAGGRMFSCGWAHVSSSLQSSRAR